MRHFMMPEELCKIVGNSIRMFRRPIRFCNNKMVVIIGLAGKLGQFLLLLLELKLLHKKLHCHIGNWQRPILRFSRGHLGNNGGFRRHLERKLLYYGELPFL